MDFDDLPDADSWKTQEFREIVAGKIEMMLRATILSGVFRDKDGTDWENALYLQSKTKEEYLHNIIKFMKYLQTVSLSASLSQQPMDFNIAADDDPSYSEMLTENEVLARTKVFNDPIHGHIEMHPLCVKIIDTPQFQRLRYLKQLGASYYVFPGASHNRFEHCLGVCHLAGELLEALRLKQSELEITDKDVLCVKIAGLCHDLGHGPFSHMFDAKFIPAAQPGSSWKHEDASVTMFDHMVRSNNLFNEFKKYGFDNADLDFIKEQIAGPKDCADRKGWPYCGRPKEKGFLYEIVANKRNGIDVDKWDYFARDCYHLGIRNVFDHHRFMKFARVVNVFGEPQICSRDKEAGNLYDMFYTRTVLHRRAYQHKTTIIIEYMICEALLLANEHLLIPGLNGHLLKLSDTIYDMVAYTKVTDSLFLRIMHSTEPELEEARRILENVQCRRLYRFIGQTNPKPGREDVMDWQNRIIDQMMKCAQDAVSLSLPDVTGDAMVAGQDSALLREFCREVGWQHRKCSQAREKRQTAFSADDIVVLVSKFDYGMQNRNPVDHVRFYTKANPTVAVQVRKNQVSQMLPENFSEKCIRVYCKLTDAQSVDAATECFKKACEVNDLIPPKGGDLGALEFTPEKDQSSPSQPAEAAQAVEAPGDDQPKSPKRACRALGFEEP